MSKYNTVNSELHWIYLPKVFGEIRKTNKRRPIIVHHDNAFLTGQNVELMGHPPYSPDLAHNDLSLFPHIKKKTGGQRFSSPEYAVEAFKNHILEV